MEDCTGGTHTPSTDEVKHLATREGYRRCMGTRAELKGEAIGHASGNKKHEVIMGYVQGKLKGQL